MVSFTLIKEANSKVDDASSPRVAVFVGATSGIGKITLKGLASMETSLKAYVLGRKMSASSFKIFADGLQATHPRLEIVWVESEVSVLTDVRRACDEIKTKEKTVDLLFMTAGYVPFGGRNNTTHALEYYSRIAFVLHLLPLLRASGRGRVVSVLGGGMEKSGGLHLADLNLEQPGAFSAIASQRQMSTMGSIALERLAEEEENHSVVFIHSYPGVVLTGNLRRGWGAGSWGPILLSAVLYPILWFLKYSMEESSARHAYISTSGTFGGRGPCLPGVVGRTTRGKTSAGLFLVNQVCDAVTNENNMADLRETAREAVWKKTKEIIEPYL